MKFLQLPLKQSKDKKVLKALGILNQLFLDRNDNPCSLTDSLSFLGTFLHGLFLNKFVNECFSTPKEDVATRLGYSACTSSEKTDMLVSIIPIKTGSSAL